jgi:hypothetical protein
MVDQTTAAMFGAAIGAAGAVTAQIVSAGFNARRENRRLQWEQQRTEETATIERQRLFLDSKRQAFVRFLQLSITRHDLLVDVWIDTNQRRNDWVDLLRSSSRDWWKDYMEALGEITLLAPEIEEPARQVLGVLAEWENDVLWEDFYDGGQDFTDRYAAGAERVGLAMRANLGLDPA